MHTQNQRTPSAFSAALAGRKIVFNATLCEALGDDIHATLLLGQLLFWQEHAEWKPEFVAIESKGETRWMFAKTWNEIQAVTRIKRDTQQKAREVLQRLGLVETVLHGMPAKLHYWVNVQAIEVLMTDFLNNDRPTTKPVFASANTGTHGKDSQIGKTRFVDKSGENKPENSEKYTDKDIRNKMWEYPQQDVGMPATRCGNTRTIIESIKESNNNNKNITRERESENSEAEKCLNYEVEQSFECETDNVILFDFSTENEKPKIATSTVEVKNTETSQNCAVPEFFADATQVHEAIEMLLKTEFQSERFAHHYKIHGGVEFLQGIANFFADPEKAIWLLKETGVENMADVWPVLAAFIAEVILKQHGYDRQGDINNHIRNFFSSHTRKTAEVSVAKNLTAAKEVMVKRIEQRNQEFSVKVNQDKIQSSQPQKRNPNVRGLNFLNANG